MPERLSAWEKEYRKVESLWGFKPDPILMEYADLVPKGKVLDLGIGEGRNSLPFAKIGYEVEGCDISPTAIKRCIAIAKKEKLKVKVEAKDLLKIDVTHEKYSLIIGAWVLNFFRKNEAVKIIKKIRNGLKKTGLFTSQCSPRTTLVVKELKEIYQPWKKIPTMTERKIVIFITLLKKRSYLHSPILNLFTIPKASN